MVVVVDAGGGGGVGAVMLCAVRRFPGVSI